MKTTYKGKTVIFESPLKTILLFLLSTMFAVLPWYTDMVTERPIVFWSGFLLFGFGSVSSLIKLLDPRHTFISTSSTLGKQLMEEKYQAELEDPGDFSYNDLGFKVDIKNESENYAWQEIKAVFAYKRDDYTVDTICLAIYMHSDLCLTINENTAGWYQFIQHLSKNIAIADPAWQVKIINPAFATNLTLLYDKQNRSFEEVKAEYFKHK